MKMLPKACYLRGKNLSLSPYVNQVYLKAEDANLERLKKFLATAKNKIASRDIETYGPFESPIQKKNLISIECFV